MESSTSCPWVNVFSIPKIGVKESGYSGHTLRDLRPAGIGVLWAAGPWSPAEALTGPAQSSFSDLCHHKLPSPPFFFCHRTPVNLRNSCVLKSRVWKIPMKRILVYKSAMKLRLVEQSHRSRPKRAHLST